MLIWSHGQHKPQIDTKPLYTAKWNKTSSSNATKGEQVWWDYQAPKNQSFKSIHSSYNSRLWGQFSMRLLYSTPQMTIIQGIANLLTICVFACVCASSTIPYIRSWFFSCEKHQKPTLGVAISQWVTQLVCSRSSNKQAGSSAEWLYPLWQSSNQRQLK